MNKILICLLIACCILGCATLHNKKNTLSDKELARLSEQRIINFFSSIKPNGSTDKFYLDTTLVFQKKVGGFFSYKPEYYDMTTANYNFKPITLHIPDSLRSFCVPYTGVDPEKDTVDVFMQSPLLRTKYPDTFMLQRIYYITECTELPCIRFAFCDMVKVYYKNDKLQYDLIEDTGGNVPALGDY